MDGTRKQFFADARLPLDEYRDCGTRRLSARG